MSIIKKVLGKIFIKNYYKKQCYKKNYWSSGSVWFCADLGYGIPIKIRIQAIPPQGFRIQPNYMDPDPGKLYGSRLESGSFFKNV